jgi:hypothetical protein
MTIPRIITRKATGRALWFRVSGLGVLALFLCTLAADTSQAQQIPRRLDTLQLVRPIAPAPVAPVERLREDIIRSVDPRTGRIDVQQLRRPQQFPSSQPIITGGSAIPKPAPGQFPSSQQTVTGGEATPIKKPQPFPTGGKQPPEDKNGATTQPCR